MTGRNISPEVRLIKDWNDSEDEDPTDPFTVLGLDRKCTTAQVHEAVRKRLRTILGFWVDEDEVGSEADESASWDLDGDDIWNRAGSTGSSAVLLARTRRAYHILGDEDARAIFERTRISRIKEKAVARLHYANGTYEGGVLPGSMEGKDRRPRRAGRGITVMDEGAKHEGLYVDDLKHGIGLQMWRNGDVFLGHWEKDLMHGLGVYYYANGNIYSGQFRNDAKQGTGEQVWLDGSVYKGAFVKGQRSGPGTLTLPPDEDGNFTGSYEGEWKEDQLWGKGTFRLKDEGVYEGEFDGCRFHGFGKFSFADGGTLACPFKRGRRDEKVEITWADGGTFTGELVNGNLHTGTYLKTGFELSGTWQHNKLHGKGKAVWHQSEAAANSEDSAAQESITYLGQFKEGKMYKHGELIYPDGTRYSGIFDDDQKHGKGEIAWPDGSTFRGHFDRDKREGVAFTTPADAATTQTRKELWQDDLLIECAST